MIRIHRALLSVSDKRGIIEFARGLSGLGIEIISTGHTRTTLQSAGIAATAVSDVTGFPEILGGRVKTLHPKIHGAILAVPDDATHVEEMERHGITSIDLVAVNFYPFEATIRRAGITLPEAVEQIDIGGLALLRAAAKNFRYTAVVVSPDRYAAIIDEMRTHDGCVPDDLLFSLAREAFLHVARYDAVIAEYFDRLHLADREPLLPEFLSICAAKEQDLRYGENPHQKAALYGDFGKFFEKLHGKELSFNNIVDIQAAAALISEFDKPAAAIIKHTNPCGAATGDTLSIAYRAALATDPVSAFGGIVAVNRPLDPESAAAINEIFTEVVIAPEFPPETLELLRKKKDRRLIRMAGDVNGAPGLDVKQVAGGFLVQEPDRRRRAPDDMRVVTKRAPGVDELDALLFAWRVAKHVKSNAVVYASKERTLGIGAGQMSRVDSSRIAAMKARQAGLDLRGSVVASDAFFPFADGLLECISAGATAVIEPGGSVRDEEVIRAADEHGAAMVFTGIRHFRH